MRNVVLNQILAKPSSLQTVVQGENVSLKQDIVVILVISHDEDEAFWCIQIDEIDDIKRDNIGRRSRIVLMLFLHSPRSQAY